MIFCSADTGLQALTSALSWTGTIIGDNLSFLMDADRTADELAERRVATLMASLPPNNSVRTLLGNSELMPHLQVY